MLTVEGLEAGYGDLSILRDVGLHVGRNESVAILGANGAGKSTLVRSLCGLADVKSGRIIKGTTEIHKLPPHKRVDLGLAVVLENRRLFGELSVRINLDLAAARTRSAAEEKFGLEDVLALFPFMRERLDAPVELLSGGEQQMVAIARALLLQPDLLVMDEPSTGLAPKVVKDIVGVVAKLRAKGISIILVEQNVAVAAQACDRAYVLALGNVVHEVAPGEWESLLANEAVLHAYFGGQ